MINGAGRVEDAVPANDRTSIDTDTGHGHRAFAHFRSFRNKSPGVNSCCVVQFVCRIQFFSDRVIAQADDKSDVIQRTEGIDPMTDRVIPYLLLGRVIIIETEYRCLQGLQYLGNHFAVLSGADQHNGTIGVGLHLVWVFP